MIINAIGDSITWGAGLPDRRLRWTNLVAKELDAKVNNYGVCGSCLVPNYVLSGNPVYDRDFLGRVGDVAADADVVLVMGGTNDFGYGDVRLGRLNDYGPDTFCGGVNLLWDKLRERCPRARIIVMTPIHRFDEVRACDPYQKGEGAERLETYVGLIKALCAIRGFELLDLYHDCAIDYENIDTYTLDGVHPNEAGHRVIADAVLEVL